MARLHRYRGLALVLALSVESWAQTSPAACMVACTDTTQTCVDAGSTCTNLAECASAADVAQVTFNDARDKTCAMVDAAGCRAELAGSAGGTCLPSLSSECQTKFDIAKICFIETAACQGLQQVETFMTFANKPTCQALRWKDFCSLYGIPIICGVAGLVLILCCCICRCCCRVVRTQPPAGELDRLSRAEAGMERSPAGRAKAANTAKNTDPRYPAGYEPVNASEEGLGGSVSSVNRPPSVASDSSEAAGLRLLGNDGM